MRSIVSWQLSALLAAASLLGTTTASSLLRQLQAASPAIGNIVTSDPDLTLLAAALDNLTASAAFAAALSSSSNGITLLAPTNDAFAAITDTTVGERVLTNGSGYAQHLEHLIALHFYQGTTMLADLTATSTKSGGTAFLTMANGETVIVGDGLSFTGPSNAADAPARVTTADLIATNGVVHKIDTVLLPAFWNLDVVTMVETSDVESLGTVKALFTTVQEQNPSSAFILRLAKRKEVTMFAPTDAAFQERGLLDAIQQQVSTGDDTSLLFQVLQNHVVLNSVLPRSSLVDGFAVSTMRNGPLLVERDGENILVGGSLILETILVRMDYGEVVYYCLWFMDCALLTCSLSPFVFFGQANNGIIYTIQKVLLSDDDKARLDIPTSTTVAADSTTAPPAPVQPAPVVAATKAPIFAVPTKAPVVPPTMAPVVPPTIAPVVAPTKAPTVAPTTKRPTTSAAPSSAPSPAPAAVTAAPADVVLRKTTRPPDRNDDGGVSFITSGASPPWPVGWRCGPVALLLVVLHLLVMAH
jgi:uncharacterized surface protein with fasciclin (FAS1) repeats